ncbi:MAG: hypothetical protein EZS28_006416 [Streblomastix strix]|uniref:Uncharacterized protein n=1 Tax=Streblomastix strix TaxID=222440 RepID=A0A5J4WSY4_9EUKA|nr:MAG: hypothetical protein EZS28_006416 [Streblomastix strix]
MQKLVEEQPRNIYLSHPNLEVQKFVIDTIWRTITLRQRGDDFVFSSDNFIKFYINDFLLKLRPLVHGDFTLQPTLGIDDNIQIIDGHPMLIPTLEYSWVLNSKLANTTTGFRNDKRFQIQNKRDINNIDKVSFVPQYKVDLQNMFDNLASAVVPSSDGALMASQSTKQSNIQPFAAQVNASYGAGITCHQSLIKSKLQNRTGKNHVGYQCMAKVINIALLFENDIILQRAASSRKSLLKTQNFTFIHSIGSVIFVLAQKLTATLAVKSETTAATGSLLNYIANVFAGIFIVQFTQHVQTIEQVADPLAASGARSLIQSDTIANFGSKILGGVKHAAQWIAPTVYKVLSTVSGPVGMIHPGIGGAIGAGANLEGAVDKLVNKRRFQYVVFNFRLQLISTRNAVATLRVECFENGDYQLFIDNDNALVYAANNQILDGQASDFALKIAADSGDFAYSAESGTVWMYDSNWYNSGQVIPYKVSPTSDALPMADSGAGVAGISTEYSRGDYQHPLQVSEQIPSRDSATGTAGTSTAYS